MRKLFALFRKRRWRYDHLVNVIIHKQNLLSNLEYFQVGHPNHCIVPVLKSNAYGHGLVPVARIFEKTTVPLLVIDSYHEALILRNEGVKKPLLILGYTPEENILRHRGTDIAFTIGSLSQLKSLADACQRPCAIHLKIDTGMHRQGIDPSECDAALAQIQRNANLHLEGVCSHFADADTDDSTLTARQIILWNECVARVRKATPDIRWRHIAASAGHRFAEECDANMMRVGLGLYGYGLPEDQKKLKPVLEMRTRITAIRTIEKGESIGYNGTFSASRPMRIATIPVGYSEGLDRELSNIGSVTICERPCPIVGRVSMNMTTVDITGCPDALIGSSVTVISDCVDAPNALGSMARMCETIPYVLLVHIPALLRRTVI